MSLNMKRQMQSPVCGMEGLAGLLLCEKGPGGPAGHYAKHEPAGLYQKVYSQQSTESHHPPSLITL